VGVGVEEAVDEELLAVDVHQPRHQRLAVDGVHTHGIGIGDLEALSEPAVAVGCRVEARVETRHRLAALCTQRVGLQAGDHGGLGARHHERARRDETRQWRGHHGLQSRHAQVARHLGEIGGLVHEVELPHLRGCKGV